MKQALQREQVVRLTILEQLQCRLDQQGVAQYQSGRGGHQQYQEHEVSHKLGRRIPHKLQKEQPRKPQVGCIPHRQQGSLCKENMCIRRESMTYRTQTSPWHGMMQISSWTRSKIGVKKRSELHRRRGKRLWPRSYRFMKTYSNYGARKNHKPLCSHRRRHRGHLCRKKVKRPCNTSSRVGRHSC